MLNLKSDEAALDDIVNVRFHTGFTKCNFTCDYCIAGHGNTADPETEELEDESWDGDRFERIVENLSKLPFRMNIRLQVPGEIFLNKRLLAGAKTLAQSPNVRSLNILTNLSFSVDYYKRMLSDIDASKWAFVASFHPTEVKDRSKWIESGRFFNEKFDFAVILVAYPPLIDELTENRAMLKAQGFEVFIQAYIGYYEEKLYPDSYTVGEKELLKSLFYSRHDFEFLVRKKKPGLCNAGFRSFYIRESGVVVPCGMGPYAESIGDLFVSPKLKLQGAVKTCPFAACQCDTENMNTVIFRNNYAMTGSNQHKYRYRFADLAVADPALDEWVIAYDD